MLSSFMLVLGVVLGLFVGLLLCVEAGYEIGRRRWARDPQGAGAGQAAVEVAVFGLLGLLLAFTFGGAATRFEARRALAVEEANDIGTAWLRLDLLAAEDQPALRDLFRRYLDTRIAHYQKLPDYEAARVELQKGNALQGEIWSRAVAASRRTSGPEATILLLPALNAMIDVTTTRARAGATHLPGPILASLFAVSLLSAIVAGHAMAAASRRNVLQAVLFSAAVALTIYVILDYEYPRIGMIRLDAADVVMTELRESLK
jgi:hypothetical protein